MKLADIGEREIIKTIIKSKFFGDLDLDDCAVIELNGVQLVISVDQAFANPFVLKIGGTLKELGQLFVTQNVSDIAAMGCGPIGFMFCVSLPKEMEVTDFELLLTGIKEELVYYDVPLLGGDTKEAEKIYLSGTILGKSQNGNMLRRRGAESGDLICLSKPIGKSFANYIDYSNKKTSQLFTPKANVELGKILADSNLCNCCIDTSDGVFSSLQLLADENELTFNVDLDRISYCFPDGFENDLEWVNYVLNIGGDFGLLFTLKNDTESEKLIRKFDLLEIGYVSKSDQKIALSGSYAATVKILPWEHFSNLDFFKINFDKFIINDVHDL